MKIMFKKRYIVYYAMLVLFILIGSVVLLYHTEYGYDRVRNNLRKIPIIGNSLDTTFVEIVDELDINKKIKQTNLPDSKYVNLVLSGSDLKNLQKSIKKFQNYGFILDEENKWRKAKELVNRKELKIKYKLHGTSISSAKNNNPDLWGALKISIGIESYDPISGGSVSYKIKYPKKKGTYKELKRSYILKSSKDSFNLSKIALNKIASSEGLISPYGKVVILRINGSEIAPYYMVENYNSKEWFERNYNLTNYTILKSNDDWDHAGRGHASRTDLLVQDKEVGGSSEEHPIALGALSILFKAINNNDIDTIKNLIDLKYTAKFMAILSVVNNLHTITGDQLRYIYDHSTGQFKFMHKLENFTYRATGGVADFNANLFKRPAAQTVGAKTYDLFKLLITDPEFRELRDTELLHIVNKRNKNLKIADKVFDENISTLFSSNLPLEPIYADFRNFKKTFNNNLDFAKKYLKYNKIYITVYESDRGNKLSIINDSYNSVTLKKVHYLNNGSIEHNEIINSNILNEHLDIKHSEQTMIIKKGDIEKLIFINNITGEVIKQKHIYINYAQDINIGVIDNAINVLDKNEIKYIFNKNDKSFIIEKGLYQLNADLLFPKGYSLTFKPGVVLELGGGVSILIKGEVFASGTKSFPIVITNKDKNKPFGVFAILGDSIKNNSVFISHMDISGGSSALISGVSFSGQMSIHNSNVLIKNMKASGSVSDDGVNIKNSTVEIHDSHIFNNFADQIDLDFCTGRVVNNSFSVDKKLVSGLAITTTDGLDISGGRIEVVNNYFTNFSDKAISVGENSTVFIDKNNISSSNIGVAIKDGSVAFMGPNVFHKNENNISVYIKKKFYRPPQVYSSVVNSKKRQYVQYENLKSNFNDYKIAQYE